MDLGVRVNVLIAVPESGMGFTKVEGNSAEKAYVIYGRSHRILAAMYVRRRWGAAGSQAEPQQRFKVRTKYPTM